MTLRIFLFTLLMATARLLSAQIEITKLIHFDFDHSSLSEGEKQRLDSIVQVAKQHSMYTITLKGHTDGYGSNSYNDALSKARNRSVKNYLISKQLDSSRIKIEAFGENVPLVENSSRANRAQNRRVELKLVAPKNPVAVTKQEPIPEPVAEKKPKKTIIGYGGGKASSGDGTTIEVSVISNTQQMEKEGFTTMTDGGEALNSNFMVCWQPETRGDSCRILKEPIVIWVPVNNKTICSSKTAKVYDAVKDPVSGEIVWAYVTRTYEVVVGEDGKEYFVIPINNTCAPCINFDCPAPSKTEPVTIAMKGVKITGVSTVYTTANSRLIGKKVKVNKWTMMRLADNPSGDEVLKIKAKDKRGKNYLIEVKQKDLKANRKGVYKFKKGSLKVVEESA